MNYLEKQEIINRLTKSIEDLKEFTVVDHFIDANFQQFCIQGEYDDNSLDLNNHFEMIKLIESDDQFFRKLNFVLTKYVKSSIIKKHFPSPETGVETILKERERQISQEGWSDKHDDDHSQGELALAGAYYALRDEDIDFINNEWGNDMHLHLWPFDLSWIKRTPDNRIKELGKAGALIAAEIDRINRIPKTK